MRTVEMSVYVRLFPVVSLALGEESRISIHRPINLGNQKVDRVKKLAWFGRPKILNDLYTFNFEQNARQWIGGSGHDGDGIDFSRHSVTTEGQ
jgi:hypothetical protein